jgi:8-oxo-dGTP pyrophosphatase MutT (NUDIX family)
VKHKKYICNNCDKHGHDSKSCPEPVTSWGIILVKFDNLGKVDISHSKNTKLTHITEVKLEDTLDINKATMLIDRIQFLMISRKHSLGFIEFMMGRYSLINIDHLSFLIKQMLPLEIKNIRDNINNFDKLWEELWGKTHARYNNEYHNSKKLFEKLNDICCVDITLEFLLDNISPSPIYKNPEYGFPKGRKNKGERGRDCAIREFQEESGFTLDDIKIIDDVEPIVENLTGTNGIRYRHIYYLAELVSDKQISLTNNEHQIYEIGSVGFYTFNDVQHHIRPYHIEKKNIVTKLFFYYIEKLMNLDKA